MGSRPQGAEGVAKPDTIVRGFELAEEAAVSLSREGKGKWYPGVVEYGVPRAFYVNYEDGESGWVTIAQCRIPAKSSPAGL